MRWLHLMLNRHRMFNMRHQRFVPTIHMRHSESLKMVGFMNAIYSMRHFPGLVAG